jgi:hypothetical protein
MKKALVVLLILAIAGGLFAQGLEWSGAVKTGLQIKADDGNNGEDIAVTFRSDDADSTFRFDLNGKYTKDNYGVVFGLRFEPALFIGLDFIGANPPRDPDQRDIGSALSGIAYNAYGWATFVNDIIKLSAGVIDDGVWKTGGLEDYGISGTGLRLEIAPITGLNFGFMLKAADFNMTIKEFLSETAFGAKYSSDLFWVAAGLTLDGTADELDTDPDLKWTGSNAIPDPLDPTAIPDYKDSDHGLDFQAGVGVTALPGLTVSVEAKARNASKFNDYGQFILDEKVSYKLLEDKLEVGLKAYQFFWAKDGSKHYSLERLPQYENDEDLSLKPYLTFTPYLAYDVLPSLNAGFEVKLGLWSGMYDYELGFKPKITYKIAEKAKLVAFYNFSVVDWYDDWDGGRPGSPTPVIERETDKSNTIQIDFVWEF